MIVRETWKPPPIDKFLCTYKGIESSYWRHLRWIGYIDWKKETNQIKDFQYIFNKSGFRFSILHNNKTYFYIPFIRIVHLHGFIEYQAYSNLNKFYMKMWKKLEKQKPYIHNHSRVLSKRDIHLHLFKLWNDEERRRRFEMIKFLGDIYNND